ncbi:hypothetical protein BDZ94DRAFT_805836 [Collybia nuda]|uniref:Uncharacterized protein n=1 Tax=Collybia nuda TaxID=64659 RepID=A0A9P5Y3G4_9AGAR|nr:hypothetical protein BDZ94DRAFT_805836 [Collybia nuda]
MKHFGHSHTSFLNNAVWAVVHLSQQLNQSHKAFLNILNHNELASISILTVLPLTCCSTTYVARAVETVRSKVPPHLHRLYSSDHRGLSHRDILTPRHTSMPYVELSPVERGFTITHITDYYGHNQHLLLILTPNQVNLGNFHEALTECTYLVLHFIPRS